MFTRFCCNIFMHKHGHLCIDKDVVIESVEHTGTYTECTLKESRRFFI